MQGLRAARVVGLDGAFYLRAMQARLVFFSVVLMGCGSAPSVAPTTTATAPERALAPVHVTPVAADVSEAAETSDELSWDSHIGWEPRHHFAPGERSYRRPEGSHIVLEYALGPMFEGIAERSAGMPLQDKPLIVRNARELCDPTLQAAVTNLAPERLLIQIDADLDDTSRDCLATLEVPQLFISTCRHDGAMPTIDHCSDGDAQLALLAANEELRAKLRGLAIGFGERSSWALLTSLTQLTHLSLRGSALLNIDIRGVVELCSLEALHHVDALNANTPGAEFPMIPAQCLLRWRTFKAWSLDPVDLWLENPSAFPTLTCHFEHLFLERVEAQGRQALETSCTQLRELEVMHPTERCTRSNATDSLTCTPL